VPTKRITAGKITDARFSEVSFVDHPANSKSTINQVELAKREAAKPVLDELIAQAPPAERGIIRGFFEKLFGLRERTPGASIATDKAVAADPVKQEIQQILADVTAEDIDEWRKGETDMALSAEALELVKQAVAGLKDGKVEKKLSMASKGHFDNMKKCMDKADGCFGKGDYEDGTTHFNAGMNHMAKMDATMADAVEFGEADDKSPGDADSPAKASQLKDLVKAAVGEATANFSKQMESLRGDLKAATEKSAELEKENIYLKGQVDALGNQPIKPKAQIGGSFLRTVQKGEGAEHLAREAGNLGANAADIDLSKLDPKHPEAFRTALTKAYAQPQRMSQLKAEADQATL